MPRFRTKNAHLSIQGAPLARFGIYCERKIGHHNLGKADASPLFRVAISPSLPVILHHFIVAMNMN